MSAIGQPQPYPLEGRNLAQVTREEIAEAVLTAPRINLIQGVPSNPDLSSSGRTAPQIYPGLCTPPIARVSSSMVVKYGRHIQLCEARNMQWVAENTSIRVPKVVDAWEANDKTPTRNNTCYIVMEYIEGKPLSDIWADLNLESRRSMLDKVAEYIRQLRSVKLDVPGPIGGGLSEGSFFTDYGAGPFYSRKEMESWFNERLQVCHDFGIATHTPTGWFTGRFGSLVMCHLDIEPRNVLLDNTGNLWLIDWAFSGAYPPYFETAHMTRRGPGDWEDGLLERIGTEGYREDINQLMAITFALTTGACTKPRIKAAANSTQGPNGIPGDV